MNYCPTHGIIAEQICKRCNKNGRTPAWKLARTGLYMMLAASIGFIFLAPFLFEPYEINMFRDAVIVPLVKLFAIAAILGGFVFWIFVIIAGLNSRNVRLK
jgi:hypothetical protein